MNPYDLHAAIDFEGNRYVLKLTIKFPSLDEAKDAAAHFTKWFKDKITASGGTIGAEEGAREMLGTPNIIRQ